MNQTISLQQSVMLDIASMMGDHAAMKKIYAFLQKLKSDAEVQTKKDEKAEILNDIRQGLIELNLVKQGQIQSRPVEELFNEI